MTYQYHGWTIEQGSNGAWTGSKGGRRIKETMHDDLIAAIDVRDGA